MTARRGRVSWAAWAGVGAALLLVAAAMLLPRMTGWEVWARAPRSATSLGAPPWHGYWQPKVGLGTVPAVALAVLGCWFGPRCASRLAWRTLLGVSYSAALAWMLALALVDGPAGISRALGGDTEYLPVARSVTGVTGLLQGYVDRIPLDAAERWPTQVAGHPPAMVLFFVLLAAVGLGGDLAAGMVVCVVAASTVAAVLVTLRALGEEELARRAAPYLVLTPAAVFVAVSADAVIATTAAWSVACLALASRAGGPRGVAWAAGGGLLMGLLAMMSYGMPLFGLVVLAVPVVTRRWRPLAVFATAALLVVVGFAVAGFAWWEAFPILRERYWSGVAGLRPPAYWVWADLALLAATAGPVVMAGLARLLVRPGRMRAASRALVAGTGLAVLVADLSLMSMAEVERIWLPFVPWLTLAVGSLPTRWVGPGLAGQAATALTVQHLLYTTW